MTPVPDDTAAHHTEVIDWAIHGPALLARIAELEGERDERRTLRSPAECDEPCPAPWPGRTPHQCVFPDGHDAHWDGKGDVWLTARWNDAELAEAESKGRQWAIDALRDARLHEEADHSDPNCVCFDLGVEAAIKHLAAAQPDNGG